MICTFRAAKSLNFAAFYFVENLYLFIDKAFRTTLTDENAIAAAAIEGFKTQPVTG